MLIRVAWAGLLASLVLVLQVPVPRLEQWFGLCLIGMWLMSFLLGMLQRILPFLAAMHGGSGRRAHTPSSLSFDPALRVLFAFHLTALVLLALAFAADSRWLMLAASLIGAVGALAFATFYGVLLRRMRRPRG